VPAALRRGAPRCFSWLLFEKWHTVEVRIHPGGFRLILAGPKVARLLPYIQAKGFMAEAFTKGSEALNRMRQAPCHLLLLELECGDTMGVDLARGAKQEGITGAALLVDDPMKSGMIISALARGVDSYVSIPPDEIVFFERIEGILLAQWGLVVTQQQQQLVDEVARLQAIADSATKSVEAAQGAQQKKIAELERQLAAEKKKVQNLDKETDVLREQLATMHLVTGAKSGHSDEGQAQHGNDEEVEFLIDDVPSTVIEAHQPARPARPVLPPGSGRPAKTPTPPPPAPAPPAPSMALDDFDADLGAFDAATSPNTPQAPKVDDNEDFDVPTQAIPIGMADSLKRASASAAPGFARTTPSMKAVEPSHEELADFEPGGAGLDGGDASTMAMSADVARSLLDAAKESNVDDAHTMAMSADMARALVAGALAEDDDDGALLDDLESQPTHGSGFGHHADEVDDDARTMAIPQDVAKSLVAGARKSPPAPRRPQAPAAFDFEDEATPAAGVGRAPAVPKASTFSRNDDNTAPGGIDASAFDTGQRKAKATTNASLDSQLLRDLAGIPSADDEEVLFAEED